MATGAPLSLAGRSALERGDLDGARRLAAVRMTDAAGRAEGHFLLGMADAGSGRVADGIRQIEQAVAIAPHGEYRAQLARPMTNAYECMRSSGVAGSGLRRA